MDKKTMNKVSMNATREDIESLNKISEEIGAHVRIETDNFRMAGARLLSGMTFGELLTEAATIDLIGNVTDCEWAVGYADALVLMACARVYKEGVGLDESASAEWDACKRKVLEKVLDVLAESLASDDAEWDACKRKVLDVLAESLASDDAEGGDGEEEYRILE